MEAVLTIGQINRQFKDEWVLVENPRVGKGLKILGGRVKWHSKNRDEVYRKASEVQSKRFAMLYTGTIPKNTAIIL
jgi:hypothetical protein